MKAIKIRSFVVVLALITSVSLLWVGYVGFMIVDKSNGDAWYKNHNIPYNCHYVLPDQYSLVVNNYKQYGIEYTDIYVYHTYLHITRDIVGSEIDKVEHSSWATTFKDSCQAKEFCKKYVEQEEERDKKYTFKEVHPTQ